MPSFADLEASASIEEAPRVDDRFVLERAVGRGGMGTVYRARRVENGEVVALKIMRSDITDATRVTREAAALFATLEHPASSFAT